MLRRLLATSLEALGAIDGPLPGDAPQRILAGTDVADGRAYLADAGRILDARRVAARTGVGSMALWLRGIPVRFRLDEGDASVEFPSGLVLIGRAERDGRALRVAPRRRELSALALIIVPDTRSTGGGSSLSRPS